MSLQLVPKSGMLLVRPIATKVQQSGSIVLADVTYTPDTTGEVIALAERFVCPECGGGDFDCEVQVGDVVMFAPSAGNLVAFNGQDFLLMREADVLAIVEEGVEAEVV
jgi:chaperonin GroES